MNKKINIMKKCIKNIRKSTQKVRVRDSKSLGRHGLQLEEEEKILPRISIQSLVITQHFWRFPMNFAQGLRPYKMQNCLNAFFFSVRMCANSIYGAHTQLYLEYQPLLIKLYFSIWVMVAYAVLLWIITRKYNSCLDWTGHDRRA